MVIETPFELDQLVRHKDWTLTFMVLNMTITPDGWKVAVTDVEGAGWWQFNATELSGV